MPMPLGLRGRVSVPAVSLRRGDLGRKSSSSSSLAGAQQLRRALTRDRGRVADVLHAEIAQELAAAIMELGLVAGALAHSSVAADERDKLRAGLERTETLLRKCVHGVGALETSLRPPLLARAGLLAALRWFAEKEAGQGAALTLELPPSLPRAGVETEQDLFDSVAAIVRDGLRRGPRPAPCCSRWTAWPAVDCARRWSRPGRASTASARSPPPPVRPAPPRCRSSSADEVSSHREDPDRR